MFTNHSGLTGESFLLRMDLKTGAVLNLTNGTAGAEQVNDALPKWSPDSSKIAFTWTEGANTDVFVMNASDGKAVTHITDDEAYDMDPAWSPDGSTIVYSRHTGSLAPSPAELDTLFGLPKTGLGLVKVDVHSGHQTVADGAVRLADVPPGVRARRRPHRLHRVQVPHPRHLLDHAERRAGQAPADHAR